MPSPPGKVSAKPTDEGRWMGRIETALPSPGGEGGFRPRLQGEDERRMRCTETPEALCSQTVKKPVTAEGNWRHPKYYITFAFPLRGCLAFGEPGGPRKRWMGRIGTALPSPEGKVSPERATDGGDRNDSGTVFAVTASCTLPRGRVAIACEARRLTGEGYGNVSGTRRIRTVRGSHRGVRWQY